MDRNPGGGGKVGGGIKGGSGEQVRQAREVFKEVISGMDQELGWGDKWRRRETHFFTQPSLIKQRS